MESGARKNILKDIGALSIGPKSAISWICGRPILLTGLEGALLDESSRLYPLMERDMGL